MVAPSATGASAAAQSVVSTAASTVNQVKSAAKWDSRTAGVVPHDTSYYAKCLLGGVHVVLHTQLSVHLM